MAVRYAALSACWKVRMPSVRAEKYIRDASGWRKDVTDGNDNGTDGQTDRQTECHAICGPLLGRRAA